MARKGCSLMVKSLRSAISKRPAAAERFFSYAQIILGALIGGAAYPLFMTPNKIAPGGITGIATILNHLFQWPVGTVTLILNVPLFLISYRAMGRIFAFRSLVATLFFTLFIDVLPLQPMTTDPLLGALYGGAVVVSAGFLIGATEALYSLICIFLSARIMDTIIIGFSSNKACFIISSRWQEISDRIMRDMDRGVTQLTARGAYTGAERPTLLCVIGRSEIMALKRILREEDEKAFVIIVEAHEAIGDGFTHLTD